MKQIKQKQKYATELKIEIAKAYLSGGFSYAKLASDYGLPHRWLVQGFVKWYQKKGNFVEKSKDIQSDMASKTLEVSLLGADSQGKSTLLLERIRDLEQQVRGAELERSRVEILLDISIEVTGYDPRKKSGTKQ